MLRSTSLKTYRDEVEPTLGARQEAVLNAFSRIAHGFTNSELAAFLEWPINTITPRVKELRDMNILEECCIRECAVTHRRVNCWKVKTLDYPLDHDEL